MQFFKTIQHFSAALAIAVFAPLGCSDSIDNPQVPSAWSNPEIYRGSSDVELFGRVAAIDPAARTMSLVNQLVSIRVQQNAEIVLKTGGDEIAITLLDIQPGDSVEIRGFFGTSEFLADRVRKRQPEQQNELEIAGRVATIDLSLRQLTLVGNAQLIIVSTTAQIVLKAEGLVTSIQLSAIQVNDSVDIRGFLQTDGSLLADRVRLRPVDVKDGFDSEFEFKGAIVDIDYVARSLRVQARSELITTDNATFIFGKVDRERSSNASSDGDDDAERRKEPIPFDDLVIGDIVEIHANGIDANTLYAVAIEVEDARFQDDLEIEFRDFIASVDLSTLTVTFQNRPETGIIAHGAVLMGFNNEIITLADFATGQLVEVEGFSQGGLTFQIIKMNKED